MQSFDASSRLSSGALAAMIVLAIPMQTLAAMSVQQQLKTDTPQAQTTIKEWHWRDMAF